MRKLLFFIPVLLCTFGCRGWYTIVPDVDSVDSVVYTNDFERGCRIVIVNPDTIKEIGDMINDCEKQLLPVIFCKSKMLSFHYKDTLIRIGTDGSRWFSCNRGVYELPDDIDNLVKKYFKKQQKH